jgi:Domain of unknown function (DUF4338)
MQLNREDAIYAADKFITYYTQFQRIDDYLRFVKKDRMSNQSGTLFGPEDEIFCQFDMHPNDMNFKIHQVDTSAKPKSKYNQSLYSEVLNQTASNAIEEAIPGRTLKWIVTEENTKKIAGVVRFGSPTINSKPRNDYFGEVLPLSNINAHFVMGFNIVPTQPFGFNYLGGKLLALLASSQELKMQFDEKYGTDLKYFETTSLYGTTKGVSMYDGLKPFVRHIGDTESDFLPLFHDDEFRDFFWWFNERNGGERLVSADKSSKKLKIQQKMISIIRKSLDDEMKLKQFNDCINHAKTLTEKKRYYLGDFRHTAEEAITWWKKKASKRYEKLKVEDRVRTELELWKPGIDLEIIR